MRAADSRPTIPCGKRILSRLRRAGGVIAIASCLQAWIPPVAGQQSPGIVATGALAGTGEPDSVSPAPTQAVTANTTGANDRSRRDDGGVHLGTFGFLVFDWDPAHGNIPGFGPLQTSPANNAIADAGR